MTPSRDQSRSSLRSYATPLLSRLVPIIVLALGVSVALHESIALPQAVRRLPFELVDHILIRSRINGQHDALLLYDPIQGLMLDADYVRRNAIPTFTGPELGMGIVRAGGAGAKEYDVSFAKDVRIEATGASVVAKLAPIIPLDSVMARAIGRRVDGLFGVDLIGSSLVEFDFAGRELLLHDPSRLVVPAGYDSLPVIRHGARAAVPLTLVLSPGDTIRGQFVLDFGMGGVLRLTTHFVDSLDLIRRTGRKVSISSEKGLGGSLSSEVTRLHSVRLGNTTISGVVASLAREKAGGDAHPPYDGLIGLGLLSRLGLLYHHDAGVVYVRRSPRVDEPFFHIETGVDLDVASPTTPLRIAAVSNGSVGDQSGLRPGDVIVQVDGKPTAGWTRRDWREALLRRIGGSASLRVRRGDHIIAVRLPVVDALQLPNRR